MSAERQSHRVVSMPECVERYGKLVPGHQVVYSRSGLTYQVGLLANDHTRLASDDVFYFGNLIGDTGGNGRVNALDLGAVKRLLNTDAAIDSPVDFNRDGRVNALDLGIVKRYLNQSLTPVAPPPLPPPATPAAAAEGFSLRRVWDEPPSALL